MSNDASQCYQLSLALRSNCGQTISEVIGVGWSRKRVGADGKVRFTAYYRDLRGRTCCAGTFAAEKAADKAWQRIELKMEEGRSYDPRRGRQRFRTYVEDKWLPQHVIELTTRQDYTYRIGKHIMPWFGHLRMIEILPPDVREWVAHLQQAGVSPATIRKLMTILSAIFQTAFTDHVTFLHPCKGVQTPAVPQQPYTIITPAQFNLLYEALPDADTKLLVETEIETGLRWGELTELRVKDFDPSTRILTVSRVVIELTRTFHPEGKRFLVKEYPKGGRFRRFKVSGQIAAKLAAHIAAAGLGPHDLLFQRRHELPPPPTLRMLANPDSLGRTLPNAAGRRYLHGTLSAYSAGKCRCSHCRNRYTAYRAERRVRGKDQPRTPRAYDADPHIGRDWFRKKIWTPARTAAGLREANVRVHDLRHAHASWLLAGGADLAVVKERLGHASIVTTQKYLHTLPDADETALDALAKVRNR